MAATSTCCCAQAPAANEDPVRLVREVVYNELHDHDRHGFWRYWIEHHGDKGTQIEEQVETVDGPVNRTLLTNGQRLDAEHEQLEEAKLRDLMNSPSEQASRRQAYREDEKRIGRILALLPDAFIFHEAGMESGILHLRYSPNSNYCAHSIEARVFRRMSGDLWLDTQLKRMRRLEGRLDDNVDFGFGMLGRVNKGSWFRMVRTQVSPTDWKTERLEVHMSGKALLLKTIAQDVSEVRGGFESVPANMSFLQGMQLLKQTVADREAAMLAGRISPASFVVGRSSLQPH